jgi:hypothetical protein
VVMLFPPLDSSATAEPETVTAESELAKTTGPFAVEVPLPVRTVTGTPAMKNELKTPVAPLAPAKLFGTVAPLTVVPLIASSS